ncbi:hypothetical protein L915_06906 [Phytophthora nicotianae]|uniref:Uncharacterized protein n=1 Tax=Phytophthora nicotianae TaxID=4792 RepID=W2H153_PHYNI|nr:hypothetical protein L915_06906 [Phytophthora nicotianae]
MTNSKYEDDFWTLKKCGEENGIVFAAHPLIHHFPWDVNEKVSNQHSIKNLTKQPFVEYQSDLGRDLEPIWQK